MTYISSRSLALILFILKETETNFISFKQNMFLNTLLKSLNFSINGTQVIVKKLIDLTQNIWNKVFQIYNAIWLYQISVSFIHKDYCQEFLYTVLCYIYRDIVRRNWHSKFISWVRTLVSSNISLLMIFVVPPLWRTSFSSHHPISSGYYSLFLNIEKAKHGDINSESCLSLTGRNNLILQLNPIELTLNVYVNLSMMTHF